MKSIILSILVLVTLSAALAQYRRFGGGLRIGSLGGSRWGAGSMFGPRWGGGAIGGPMWGSGYWGGSRYGGVYPYGRRGFY